MTGPQLLTHPTNDWQNHLKAENVQAWYHNPKVYALLRRLNLEALAGLLAPRGYSRPDQDGVPDSDDIIVVKASILAGALRFLEAIEAGRKPTWTDMDAAYVIWHEWLHCKVPWEGTVPAAEFKRLDELYGHPNALGAGLAHAVRRKFPVNAFSGLLRWRRIPLEDFPDFIGYLRGQRELRSLT